MGRKKKTAYKKGEEFEKKFANYMLKELGYDRVKVRKSITGQENVKGTEADIIGIEHDIRGEKFRKLAIVTLIVALMGFALCLTENLSEDFLSFFAVLEGGSLLFVLLSRRFTDNYTWVECKNRQTKTDIKMVRDLYNNVEDNNRSKDRKFKIDKMIFASSSGFVNNAEQYAYEKGIKCYMPNSKNKSELSVNWL